MEISLELRLRVLNDVRDANIAIVCQRLEQKLCQSDVLVCKIVMFVKINAEKTIRT